MLGRNRSGKRLQGHTLCLRYPIEQNGRPEHDAGIHTPGPWWQEPKLAQSMAKQALFTLDTHGAFRYSA